MRTTLLPLAMALSLAAPLCYAQVHDARVGASVDASAANASVDANAADATIAANAAPARAASTPALPQPKSALGRVMGVLIAKLVQDHEAAQAQRTDAGNDIDVGEAFRADVATAHTARQHATATTSDVPLHEPLASAVTPN